MEFIPGETNIVCTSLQKSLHFYRDILGFEMVGRENNVCYLRGGERTFTLMPVAQIIPTFAPYCSVPTISFDLMVSDIRAAYDYLKNHDVAFEKELEPGGSSFLIRDPDGLVIEITQLIN